MWGLSHPPPCILVRFEIPDIYFLLQANQRVFCYPHKIYATVEHMFLHSGHYCHRCFDIQLLLRWRGDIQAHYIVDQKQEDNVLNKLCHELLAGQIAVIDDITLWID